MLGIESEAKEPRLCSEANLKTFCAFVRLGGEVAESGLEDRVKRAKSLVFLKVDGNVVGIAALKRPESTYRNSVFKKANVPELAESFNLELGWVFVLEEHRRKGYSNVLSAAAFSQRQGGPVFATTRLDNVPMQRTLEHSAFRRLGDSWRSERGQKPMLVLYAAQ
jgi:GNAT superfamily N-acetyltransferase